MTHRCEVYSDLGGLTLNLKESDVENKNFWDELSALFGTLVAKTREKATELGNVPSYSDNQIHPAVTTTGASPETGLTQALLDYGKQVNEWFELNFDKITEGLSTVTVSPNNDPEFFNEVMDVIHWYQYFIGIKYKQANSQREPGDIYDIDYQTGTRKVALIAIDRSVAAWSIIFHELPEFEDEILQFLVILSKARQEILLRHPETMNFSRPGFDDIAVSAHDPIF
jgi:hypothetical protein